MMEREAEGAAAGARSRMKSDGRPNKEGRRDEKKSRVDEKV